MARFFKYFKLPQWIRYFLWKIHDKKTSSSVSTNDGDGDDDSESLITPPPTTTRRRQLMNKGKQRKCSCRGGLVEGTDESDSDEWSTIYLNEDGMVDSDDSVELQPLLIPTPKSSEITSRVKRVNGVTDLLEHFGKVEAIDLSTDRDGPARISVEQIGLTRHATVIPEVSKSDDESYDELLQNDEGIKSDPYLINTMKRDYNIKTKHFKLAALQELSFRVKRKLQKTQPFPSTTSVTSAPSNFQGKMQRKFYKKIGVTSDKTRFPRMASRVKEFRESIQDPAMFVMKQSQSHNVPGINWPISKK